MYDHQHQSSELISLISAAYSFSYCLTIRNQDMQYVMQVACILHRPTLLKMKYKYIMLVRTFKAELTDQVGANVIRHTDLVTYLTDVCASQFYS